MSIGGRSSLEDASEGGGALEGALTAGRLLRMVASLTPLGRPFAFGIRVAGTSSTGAAGSASSTGASTDTS